MAAQSPSSLDSKTLARRLGELAGNERQVQVEFLLHLDEFDRRRAWLGLGYGSLWTYCLEALHLREGAAGRRIAAMKVLRRFPALADCLRDGRLCLSTLAMLGPVLTDENASELVARAAYRTATEVDHLVASIKPRHAPKEGIRKVVEPTAPSPVEDPVDEQDGEREPVPGHGEAPPLALEAPRPAETRAVSESHWSLRVTVDRAFREDLETLRMLLGHKLPRGDLAVVLHEAIRCGIEKHGKRKGAVKPARKVESKASPSKDPATIPAELRRRVWERDGGRCAWTGPEGRRCNSRWQVEVDHVDPVGRGGAATLETLRLLCKSHNLLYAEQVYGASVMARYRSGEGTTHIDSHLRLR